MTLGNVGRPLFLAEPVPGSSRVRIHCPFCACFHTHNMRPDEQVVHRIAACDGPDSPLNSTGYWIQRRPEDRRRTQVPTPKPRRRLKRRAVEEDAA